MCVCVCVCNYECVKENEMGEKVALKMFFFPIAEIQPSVLLQYKLLGYDIQRQISIRPLHRALCENA